MIAKKHNLKQTVATLAPKKSSSFNMLMMTLAILVVIFAVLLSNKVDNGDVSNVAMAQDVTDAQKTLNSTLNQQVTDAIATVMEQMMKMNDTLQALQAENSNL